MNFFEYELQKEAEERKKNLESSSELFDCLCYQSKSEKKSHKRHHAKGVIVKVPRQEKQGAD